MIVEPYQNLVIGSGEPGKYLAWTLARQGQKTVVVERTAMGGSCPNIACLPTKNVIHGAKVASLVHRAAEFGIATGTVSIDMAGVFRRKRKMIDGLMEIHAGQYQSSGAELVMVAALPYQALRDGIYAHPTIAEGLTVLFAKPPIAPQG